MSEWPPARLDTVLSQYDPVVVSPSPDDRVRFAGVRWYGAGLFVREERAGSEVKGKCYGLKPGTLVYNRLFAWKQSFAVVPPHFEGVVVSNEFPQFDVDPTLALPEYLALCCSSRDFGDRALARSTGSAAVSRNRLKQEDFLGLSVPCPPIPVQRQIIDVMAAVADAIEAIDLEARTLSAVLRARRAALVNNLELDPVPAETAFDIRLGRQRSPERATGPSMTPYLRSANVGPDELRLGDVMSMDFDKRERSRYALVDGDVLVSEGSAGAEAVGMPAAWHGEIEGVVCFQNTLLRYRAVPDVTVPSFVRHWCLWAFESKTFRDTAPEGVNIKHIGDRRAKKMIVRLPSVEDQELISVELDPLSAAVASIRQEAARLREAKDALLDALLRRKVEPASIEVQ